MTRRPDDGLPHLFQQHLPLVDWLRLEVSTSARGVPDLNGCQRPQLSSGSGTEVWIECKATETMAVPLRPEQVGWIARRLRFGGRVFVAIRRRHGGGPRRGPAVDWLYLYWGAVAKDLLVGGLGAERPALLLKGGPSAWDWTSVEDVLFRRVHT